MNFRNKNLKNLQCPYKGCNDTLYIDASLYYDPEFSEMPNQAYFTPTFGFVRVHLPAGDSNLR